MTKNPKLSFFHNFYAIFVIFLTDFVDSIVEKRKQGTVLVQFSNFQCFCAISVAISTVSVDWNVDNVHQGSSLLSCSL